MIYYEDYEIGKRRELGSYRVSRDEIVEFARRFDPQPFHIDEDAARASIFGGLTGSSCHTFALMSLIHSRAGQPTALVANLGADALRFPNPVRPDDDLTLASETIEKRISKSRPSIGIIKMRSLLTNQRGEIVMEMTSSFMARRRPEAEGG